MFALLQVFRAYTQSDIHVRQYIGTVGLLEKEWLQLQLSAVAGSPAVVCGQG